LLCAIGYYSSSPYDVNCNKYADVTSTGLDAYGLSNSAANAH